MYKRRTNQQTHSGRFYRTNQHIRAKEVRLIGADDKQIGVVSISEALAQAKAANLDLIEIAATANPPVVKIADFKKFLYQENKKLQAQAKKSKTGQMKEVRLTPFMAEGDLKTRLTRIREFLEEKHRVRLTVRFHGRQLSRREFGYEVLDRITKELEGKIKIDQEPKFVGRQLMMTITPV